MSEIILTKIGTIDPKNEKIIFSNITNEKSKYHIFEPFLYKELKKCEIFGYSIKFKTPWYCDNMYRTGSVYVNLRVGEQLFFRGDRFSDHIRTSIIKEIITDELFITKNSVYFLNTPNWRHKKLRDVKLKQLLN